MISLEEGLLTIGFGYEFHCKLLREGQNKDAVTQAIEKVTGHRLRVQGVVAEQAREEGGGGIPVSATQDPQISAALEAFGGRVVG